MNTTYTPELVGELNQRLILGMVRDNGPMSRADICRRVALSFPAVSANVKALLEKDLLCELGSGSNAMGRKSTLLGFHAEHGYVVGIKVGRCDVKQMLCNLLGNAVTIQSTERGCRFTEIHEIQQCIVDIAEKMLSQTGVSKEKILCVSMSLPGIIDDQKGTICIEPYLPELRREDLVTAIRTVFGEIPILFENNVNNGALGEQWKGAGQEYHDIFYLHYGIGMGGAMILQGSLWKGTNRAAGEIGYMLLDRSALQSQFEDEGSTEKALSGHAILSLLHGDNSERQLSQWFDLCDASNKEAITLLKQLIKDVGMLLVNVTSIVDPQVIILAGCVGVRMFRHGKSTWQQMLENHVPFVPKIVCSEMNDMESLYGAVKIGLDYLCERMYDNQFQLKKA